MVPRPHLFTPRCPGQGAYRARHGDWPRLLAIGRRRTASPIYPSHYQRSECHMPIDERTVSHFLRWSARTRRFGWLHPTILPKILCTMRCIFPRTQRLFSTVTIFITTKRSTQTRMNLSHWVTLELTSLIRSFSFNPDRYMGDTLTCAESSKLPNAMDRDHWAFGAGWVSYHRR